MKAETLFERPRIEGSGDALKQSLRAFGARARDAGLATMGFNKARGRLSIRITTDKLIREFWRYIGAHDIHPVTDDTVRDYITRFYDPQLPDVEPTIQRLAGVVPQQGVQPPGNQPVQPGVQPPGTPTPIVPTPPGNVTPTTPTTPTPTWAPASPKKATPTNNVANIASTRQSTTTDMQRYQKLLGQITQSVMNPTPDPQFMNKIAAFLQSASGSNNLRAFAKKKIDELKARPDVTSRYPEIANIGDDPFANLPRQSAGYAATSTHAGGAPMPPANTPYTLNPAAPPAAPAATPPSAAAPPPDMPIGSQWTWRSNDTDYPVVVTAAPQEQNGQYWAMVQYTDREGATHQTGAPVSQLTPRTGSAAPVTATGNRFNRVQPPPLNQPQNDNAQPELSATQAVAQIGPIMSKPVVTPQERWWVMAAINNALQKTQRGTPQRQQIIATLRSLQNDPRVVSKIPQLRQIPMESHQRVFDLAVFLVENQIADKTALREAYCRIMLEATALNRGQIDQIFTVLARSLSHAGLASTQLRGKAGKKQAAQAAQSQGNAGMSLSQGHNLMKKTITASGLAFARHYFNIPPPDLKFIEQLIGTNGAQVQDIVKAFRIQKKTLTTDIADLLYQAAQYSP